MQKNTFLRIFFLCLPLVFLFSCSSKKVVVSDDSTLNLTRKELFSALDSAQQRNSTIKSYFARKASVSVADIIQRANMNIYIAVDSCLISTASLPFPPIEVLRAKIDTAGINFSSRFIDSKSNFISFPSRYLELFQSVFLGKLPRVYTVFDLNDYSNFDAYISNNQIFLAHASQNFSVMLVLNADYTTNRIVVRTPSNSATLYSYDYKYIDGYYLPTSFKFNVDLSKSKQHELNMNIGDVFINSKRKLTF